MSCEAPPAELIADVEEITLGNLGTVEADLALPRGGRRGSTYTWRSHEPLFLSHSGQVTRPSPGVGDRTTTLELTAQLGRETLTRTFEVTIIEEPVRHAVRAVRDVELVAANGGQVRPPAFVIVELEDGALSVRPVVWDPAVAGARERTGRVEGWPRPVICRVRPAPADRDPALDRARLSAGSFTRAEVRLTAGSFWAQLQDRMVDFLVNVDDDRVLYSFRDTAGLDTLGALPMTGWDAPDSLLRGHTTGHYLSALALAEQRTGHELIGAKRRYVVHALGECQVALGKRGCQPGFLSAYLETQFDQLEQGVTYPTIWAPYYTLDKIMSGLLDCAELTDDEEALAICESIGEWVHARLARLTAQQRARMWSTYIAGEYGAMIGTLQRLAVLTGKAAFTEAATWFENDKLCYPMTVGVDTLDGMHANQHIPQVRGALDLFLAGQGDGLAIAANFWRLAVDHHSYAIGGVGETEMFRAPDATASFLTEKAAESCASHNLLRLTAALFRCEPRAELMDYYERTLVNHIAAAASPRSDGGTAYFLPLAPAAVRRYDTDENTCCHGTGMENPFRFQDDIVMFRPDTAYLNLYLPSTVRDAATGFGLQIACPRPGAVTIRIERGGQMTLRLRRPDYARAMAVKVAGRRVESEVSPDGYVELAVAWRAGDEVEIEFDYRAAIERCPDDPARFALRYGPWVMAALSDASEPLALEPDELAAVFENTGPQGPWRLGDVRFVPSGQVRERPHQLYFRAP